MDKQQHAFASIDGVAERIPPETEYMVAFVRVYTKDIASIRDALADFMTAIEMPNRIYDVNVNCMTRTRLLAKLSSSDPEPGEKRLNLRLT